MPLINLRSVPTCLIQTKEIHLSSSKSEESKELLRIETVIILSNGSPPEKDYIQRP